jgi:glycosyltransferase involved in cell wall biosynthesis
MKIAIALSNTKDPNTGTASVSWNLSAGFKNAGHTCILIFKEDILPKCDGVLKQIAFAALLPFHQSLKSCRVIDVNAGDGFVLGMLNKFLRRTEPLIVARSHGLEHVVDESLRTEARNGKIKLSWKYPIYHGGYRLWQVKHALRLADMSLFLNESDRSYAIEKLGVIPERAVIVDNGIPDAFLNQNIDFQPPARVKVALIGSFIERKGISYSVPALNKLLQNNLEFEVGIFGSGVPASDIERHFQHAVLPRVQLVQSYDHSRLPSLLKDFHILLLPSLSEGFGLVTLEAMSCGLAAIVSNIAGIAERLEDRVNALIIPPRSESAIDAALQSLLDDPALLERLRRAGYAFAQRRSWQRIAASTLTLYENALAMKIQRRAR